MIAIEQFIINKINKNHGKMLFSFFVPEDDGSDGEGQKPIQKPTQLSKTLVWFVISLHFESFFAKRW